jgi:beta-glucanase (GH16 family)
MMKHLYISILIALFSLGLSSCIEIPRQVIGTAPEIDGLSSMITTVGARANLLEGVTAFDLEDGDITSSITIKNMSELPILNNVFTFDGVYSITYEIIDSDLNVITYFRTLIISLEGLNCVNLYENMTMTFCDDFENATRPNAFGVDLDKWTFQLGDGSQYGIPGWGNNEAQFYQEQNSFVKDSLLHIEAKQESVGRFNYTSSRLITRGKFFQTYGRFEARIALPLATGMWPAFWLLPENSPYGGWAASGEIDIMEAKGRFPSEASGAIHFGGAWPRNTYKSETYSFPRNTSIADFNTYAIEWRENSIKWFYNDVMFYEETEWFSENGPYPAPFNTDFHMILNLAIGGNFDGGQLPSNSDFNSPLYMKVDYVRVFSFDD